MVRKWSYLNPELTPVSTSTYRLVEQKYVFKVFRQTTRFKKSVIFPTVFFRKKDSIRKRKTNWLTLTSILFQWSQTYLKYRHIIRFHQNSSLLPVSFCTPNVDVLLKRSKNIDTVPWNSAAMTAKSVKVFQKFSLDGKYLHNPLGFSRPTSVFTKILPPTELPEYLSPNFTSYDNTLTPNVIKSLTYHEAFIYSSVNQIQHKQLFSFLVLYYQCNIHLSLLLIFN